MRTGEGERAQGADKTRPLALVTGASSGIGFSFLQLLAAEGYDILAVARHTEAIAAEAIVLRETFGVEVKPLGLDLTERNAAQTLRQLVTEGARPLTLLVNNAGFGVVGAFHESSLEDQLGMIDLNTRVVVELTHIMLPDVISTRGGIITTASLSAYLPMPYMTVYGASKRFILTFSKMLRHELKGTGVRVTAICPGFTKSAFHKRAGVDKVKLPGVLPKQTADQVAREGYAAYQRGRAVVTTGWANKVTVGMALLLQPFMGLLGRAADRRINPKGSPRDYPRD